MKSVQLLALILFLSLSITADAAQNGQWFEQRITDTDEDEFEFTDDEELSLDEDSFGFDEEQQSDDLWSQWFTKPARVSLKHETSYKIKDPTGLVNNRSSLRLEYDKYFLDDFFVRFDGKVSGYWGGDHQTGARDYRVLIKEGFLQGSFGNTSIKLGRQMLIWGESEGGAITDVISPRNLTELFFINLEESRLGQDMINVDHFTSFGDFSVFYVPQAKFNLYPEAGSAYYMDPFGGMAMFSSVDLDKQHEYGFRFKKTLGKSDVAFMAARLIDNDYISSFDQVDANGNMYFNRTAGRQTMVGATFNYPVGNFLLSGEMASKSDKLFNDSNNNVLEHDMFDTAFAVEYSINGNDIVGFELVNSHIADFNDDIEYEPHNSYSLIFNYVGFFANEDFIVNWLSILSEPYTSALHSVYTTYKFDDNLSMEINGHYLSANDARSVLYQYRDERQLVFKLQYQF